MVASVEETRRFVVVSPKAMVVQPAAPGTVPGVQGPQIWTVAPVKGEGVAGAPVWYACSSTKFTVQPGPAGTVKSSARRNCPCVSVAPALVFDSVVSPVG